MANLNKVFLMGNLTRDPELRYTPSGAPICEFGLAVNRHYSTREGEKRQETLFVDVGMWGRRGEVISEYLSKGDPIFIEGRLKLDTWETADGRRSKHSVVAENFEFIGTPTAGRGRDEAGGSQREGRDEAGGSQRKGQDEAGGSQREGRDEAGGSQREGRGSRREPASRGGAQPRAAQQPEGKPSEQEGFDVSDDEIPF